RQKAELKIREAEGRAQEILRKGVDDRGAVQREIEDLVRRRDHLFTQMQVYLKTQLEGLQDFERAELPAYDRSFHNQAKLPSQPTSNPPAERKPEETAPAPPKLNGDNFFEESTPPVNGKSYDELFDDIIDEL
ncbi:MAG: hypothetical protein AAF804_06910, partial [Bacteroidota bacterium]